MVVVLQQLNYLGQLQAYGFEALLIYPVAAGKRVMQKSGGIQTFNLLGLMTSKASHNHMVLIHFGYLLGPEGRYFAGLFNPAIRPLNLIRSNLVLS